MDTSTLTTYTPKGLARKLGVDYRVILTALKTGKLPCITYGPRRRRIRSEAAARWVADLERGTCWR